MGAVKLGSVAVTWSPDGASFDYAKDGKWYRFDVRSRAAFEKLPVSTARANSRRAAWNVPGVPCRATSQTGYGLASTTTMRIRAD